MRDYTPTQNDIREIVFATRRRRYQIPSYSAITATYNPKIDELLQAISTERDKRSRRALRRKLARITEKKRRDEDKEYTKQAELLFEIIASKRWHPRLRYRRHTTGRLLYDFEKKRKLSLLLDRYISNQLRKTFQIKIQSRDTCIRRAIDYFCSLGASKSSGFKVHQTILRIDICDFYESVNQEMILKKLYQHKGVPSFAIEYTQELFRHFNQIRIQLGKPPGFGIPTGIPISSTLGEILLESFDKEIRNTSGVGLYIRYVDDILISCTPPQADALRSTAQALLKPLGLKLHLAKKSKKAAEITENSPRKEFEYLGYRFIFDQDSFAYKSLDISKEKFVRYKEALERARVYAERNLNCWSDSNTVTKITKLYTLLLFPIESYSRYGEWRTVTGLGYSARLYTQDLLARGKEPGGRKYYAHTNLSIIQETAHRDILDLKKKCIMKDASGSWICCHCGQRAVDISELGRLIGLLGEKASILTAQAVSRGSFQDIDRLKEILWK